MTNPRAGDVPALFRHGGVPIIVAGVTTPGLVNRRGESLLDSDGSSGFTSTGVEVTVQQGALPALAVNVAITVDGLAMLVAGVHPIDDGELLVVRCVLG